MPDESAVVDAAASAAEDVVFSRFDRSAVADIDVSVTFVDDELTVEVYIDADADPAEEQRVAEDAALAAQHAADRVLAGES